ncbi:MAG: hypothetical protein ABH870_03600 [bacterium]
MKNGKNDMNYKMRDTESNIAIIDKKGIIRYIAFGKVEDKEINKIRGGLAMKGNQHRLIANISIFLIFASFFIPAFPFQANADSRFRVIDGIGITKTGYDFEGMNLFNYHYGFQLLTYVSKKNAYGIEIGHHRVFKSDLSTYEYLSVGLVLEAMLYKIWLNQMGMVGYIGTGDNKNKPFGFRTSTGLEFPVGSNTILATLLRNDIIFEDKVIFCSSLEIGIGLKF